jgi:hypothetical protein
LPTINNIIPSSNAHEDENTCNITEPQSQIICR